MGGFREVFSTMFDNFFRNMPERVEVNKTLRGRMNFKGRLFKKQTNSATKLQRKHADLQPEQNKPQNYSKI